MMKFHHILSLLFLSSTLTACMKVSDKKLNPPQVKKINKLSLEKSGYRCDLFGSEGSHEIFLSFETIDSEKRVTFYNFSGPSKISLGLATIGDFTLLGFKMIELDDGHQTLRGKATLIHSHSTKLTEDGSVRNIIGRLTLNKDLTGVLEHRFYITNDDYSSHFTDFESFAEIRNCEPFKVSIL